MKLLFVLLIFRICLSASFTQYSVTITQVQESVSDFNPESESHKNEDITSLTGMTSPAPACGSSQLRSSKPMLPMNSTQTKVSGYSQLISSGRHHSPPPAINADEMRYKCAIIQQWLDKPCSHLIARRDIIMLVACIITEILNAGILK